MIGTTCTFAKTLGAAERAWFAPPHPRFGAACPSLGIGLALGALSQRHSTIVVTSCRVEFDGWAPAALATVTVQVAPAADDWTFGAGGLAGTLGTRAPWPGPASAAGAAADPLAIVVANDAARLLGCGLCGIATAAMLSRPAAQAMGHADMILPLNAVARLVLQMAGPALLGRSSGFELRMAPIAVGAALRVDAAGDGGIVVRAAADGVVRAHARFLAE